MTIIRWRTQPELERIINQRINTEAENKSKQNCGCIPGTNIRKLPDNYLIEMAVPGLSKDALDIKAEKQVLYISYEPKNKENPENSEEVFLRREFSQEPFSRQFTLPETCDIEQIAAKYENGILRVQIPFEDPEKNKITRAIQVN